MQRSGNVDNIGADGDGGADGIGIGGSLGQFQNVSVTVTVPDGTQFGPVLADVAKGMVTFVPCSHLPPYHVVFEGKAGSGAKYYDESTRDLRSFEGKKLEGVIVRRDRNAGVTLFTDAMVKRLYELPGIDNVGLEIVLKDVGKKVAQPWMDMAKVQVAHDEVKRAINDQLPGFYRLEDLTRLPVILNEQNDREGSQVFTDNQNGVYGAVIAGFVGAPAGLAIEQSPAPGFEKSELLARDLSDGRLDHLVAGAPLSRGVTQKAYNMQHLWTNSTIGAGLASEKSGVKSLRDRDSIIFLSNSTRPDNGNYRPNRSIGLTSDGYIFDKTDCIVFDYHPVGAPCPIRSFRVSSQRYREASYLSGGIAALRFDGSGVDIFEMSLVNLGGSTLDGSNAQPAAPISTFVSPVAGQAIVSLRNGACRNSRWIILDRRY
ncbi:MAG: hypothetical protein R3E83_00620 [Burkholderiaceae bacterium]